ncbi:hypothetical protein E2C01_058621 [Portunus trituberculatus]|uniref:Uncharacterized protein n=1 Tax=Portunus trituberculatus TaxID=210409 RepID=A0A5B7H6N3_PORTR|nr:hypothetical protein [Portunus trituberculatus]
MSVTRRDCACDGDNDVTRYGQRLVVSGHGEASRRQLCQYFISQTLRLEPLDSFRRGALLRGSGQPLYLLLRHFNRLCASRGSISTGSCRLPPVAAAVCTI